MLIAVVRVAALVLAILLVSCQADRVPDTGAARSPGSPTEQAPSGEPDPTGTARPSAPGEGAEGEAQVLEVVDGDTIVARVDGQARRVRLVGVNAPESGECFAQQAARWLAERIEGRSVRLVADTSDVDRYGRLLRYVELDGADVNEELVATGHALARRYPPDDDRAETYERAQAVAQDRGAGMWSSEGGCRAAPADGVELSLLVQADAPGNDNDNLNGEWVDIRNVGEAEVDLSGWTVKDESASHRYVFDTPTSLRAGEVLRLRSGCGQDSRLERFWCISDSAIWNNSGDTASLVDADGKVVASTSY